VDAAGRGCATSRGSHADLAQLHDVLTSVRRKHPARKRPDRRHEPTPAARNSAASGGMSLACSRRYAVLEHRREASIERASSAGRRRPSPLLGRGRAPRGGRPCANRPDVPGQHGARSGGLLHGRPGVAATGIRPIGACHAVLPPRGWTYDVSGTANLRLSHGSEWPLTPFARARTLTGGGATLRKEMTAVTPAIARKHRRTSSKTESGRTSDTRRRALRPRSTGPSS
jgi:hypothetical protein